MPRLLGDNKMYREIMEEERLSRNKLLNQSRNKVNLFEDDIKPFDKENVLDETNFIKYYELLQQHLSLYTQELQRTIAKVEAETREFEIRERERKSRSIKTQLNRDNDELVKIIFDLRQLHSIVKNQFNKNEITTNDISIIQDKIREDGILQTVNNIISMIEIADVSPTLESMRNNLILLWQEIRKSIQSGFLEKVKYNDAEYAELNIEIADIEEADEGRAGRVEEGRMRPELPYIVNETRQLREKLASLTPQQLADGFQYYKWLRDEALSQGDRVKARQEQDRIDVLLSDPRLDDIFYAEGNIPPTPEELRPVGLGRSGGSQTLHPLPDEYPPRRFTPMRLYNHEGQDIYSLRKFEV